MASASMFTAKQRISDVQGEPCQMLLPIEGYENLPLLPLDMSVETLENIVPNVARNAWIAKERTDEKPSDGLTQEESASIQLYTMEWKPSDHSLYLSLNTALRAQDRDLLVPYFGYLKLILSALWKLQSIRKTVWRGVKSDLSSLYPVGKTFVWWGFSSCTKTLTLLESEKFLGNTGTRTLFNIECESGKEIQRHSYFQGENEILILPATQFHVLGKINPAPGLHIIHVRESKPPFPLLQSPFTYPTAQIILGMSDASQKPASKPSLTNSLPDTMPKESSLSIITKQRQQQQQQLSTKSTKCYENQKLETEIQQKAKLIFAEFRERQLNDEDAYLTANELSKNSFWETLSLAENKIGAVGAASLGIALQSNSTLQILRLSVNRLGDDGVTHLVSALILNKTLTELKLDGNKISDIGVIQLARMLQVNKSLISISLQTNDISDSGVTELAMSLKMNTTLKNLELGRNQITDRSVDAIVDLLRQTKSLHSLCLLDNQFSDEMKDEISQTAKRSNTSVCFK